MPADRSPSFDHPPAAVPPEHVADVVADDRCGRRDDDDCDDVEPVLPGEDAGGDERPLAGKRDAGRLDADQQKEQNESPRLVMLDEVGHLASLGAGQNETLVTPELISPVLLYDGT